MIHYIQEHIIENPFNKIMAWIGMIAAIIHAWHGSLVEKLLDMGHNMSITDIASTFAMVGTGIYGFVRAYIAYRTWLDSRTQKKSLIITQENTDDN